MKLHDILHLIFFLGYETSSTLMTFCIHELAQNPKIQDKVRQHIFEVLEKHDGKISYEAVSEMHYLEQCVNGNFIKNLLFLGNFPSIFF